MFTFRLAEPVSETVQAELDAYTPLTQQLLANRDITTAQDAADWMAPHYEAHTHDPMLLNDIEAAVERIWSAVDANEHIVIYADYDCDGIPGAVTLHDFFTAINYDNVSTYIPHRHYEGFGFHAAAAEKLHEERVANLIVTIDCGVVDVAAVKRANEIGIDVIITDHHEPKEVLPPAVAIVNPKIGEMYPFPDLCGAGVIFKLIQALLKARPDRMLPGREKWFLDMVGVATIADMVPLRGENRVLAHYGLQVLRKSRRPGLQRLLKKARALQPRLTEDDIGFTIGPRINAASRMDSPEDALHLLVEQDPIKAATLVDHLEKLNNERKGIVAAMTKDLKKRVAELDELPSVLVFGNPEWKPAIAGLAANSLAEAYNRPAFVWGRDGNGKIKGSCRSEGSSSVVALMEAASDAFDNFGGHHMSGGFCVHDDAIHTLPKELNAAFVKLGSAVAVDQERLVDADLTLEEVTPALVQTLDQIGPYGVANEKPLFRFARVTPAAVDVFGKTKEHTKVLFDTDTGRIEAIAFFTLPEGFSHTIAEQELCTLYAHVESSFFMGRHTIRLRIVDVVSAT